LHVVLATPPKIEFEALMCPRLPPVATNCLIVTDFVFEFGLSFTGLGAFLQVPMWFSED
jgi:hypothetical protein